MPSDNEILKMRSAGKLTGAEAERLLSMPHEERYAAMGTKKKMKEPEKGGTPKRIGEGMGSPGGPYTPGAKMEKQKASAAALRSKKKAATSSSSSGGY